MTDANTDSASIVDRDTEEYNEKLKHNITDLIVHVARLSGRNPIGIGREMLKYSLGKAKLTASEYVMYELYDRERYTNEERRAFIAAKQHRKIVNQCNGYGWFEVTEDKWLSSVFIGADGIAIPEILAVVDSSARGYQGVNKIETALALKTFLRGDLPYPLFCKYNNGRWSVGVSVIIGVDASHIHLRGKDPITYEVFFRDFIAGNVFLIQKFVENHSFLKKYTPSTATVRMVNMWTDGGLWTPHAILKLPAPHHVADNFWREGNLVCQLDVDTGEVLTMVGNDGPGLVRHEMHPATGKAIIGQCLPHWEKVLEMNQRAAELHHPMRYTSQDIAITEEGPVNIEFNWGSAFELPQIASGKGFMTEEVREFFRSCGSTSV